MRRLDRARYAIFLLVLLADVSRAQALLPQLLNAPEQPVTANAFTCRAAALGTVGTTAQARATARITGRTTVGYLARFAAHAQFLTALAAPLPLTASSDFAPAAVASLLPSMAPLQLLPQSNAAPTRVALRHRVTPAP